MASVSDLAHEIIILAQRTVGEEKLGSLTLLMVVSRLGHSRLNSLNRNFLMVKATWTYIAVMVEGKEWCCTFSGALHDALLQSSSLSVINLNAHWFNPYQSSFSRCASLPISPIHPSLRTRWADQDVKEPIGFVTSFGLRVRWCSIINAWYTASFEERTAFQLGQ